MNSNDDQTLIARFIGQAVQTPDAVAVRFGKTVFSYAELDRRSLELARVLRANGAGRDVPVAVYLER